MILCNFKGPCRCLFVLAVDCGNSVITVCGRICASRVNQKVIYASSSSHKSTTILTQMGALVHIPPLLLDCSGLDIGYDIEPLDSYEDDVIANVQPNTLPCMGALDGSTSQGYIAPTLGNIDDPSWGPGHWLTQGSGVLLSIIVCMRISAERMTMA